MHPPGRELKLYRAVYKDYLQDPIPSRSPKGRFHSQGAGTTTYLAASAETAWKEVVYRWRADRSLYRMVEVRARVAKIVDLTDPSTRARYGVDVDVLAGDRHEPCQQLAARLRAENVEAVWTYSKVDAGGRQLVVFLDLLAPGPYVRAQEVEPGPKGI